jgi:hypothetical protein
MSRRRLLNSLNGPALYTLLGLSVLPAILAGQWQGARKIAAAGNVPTAATVATPRQLERSRQGTRVHNYIIRLDEMRIQRTRAPHEDTDVLAFGLKVGDKVFEPQVMSFGDVNDGRHRVKNNNHTGSCADVCQFGPIAADDDTPVVFNYVVVNKEGGATPGTKRKVIDASLGLLNGDEIHVGGPKDDLEIPTSLWGAAYQGLEQFHSVLFGGCDGPVIVDQVPLSGRLMFAKTDNPEKAHTEERFYKGTDSMTGCGRNSEYFMKWTILRQ